MSRALVIFARSPESEARAKGLPTRTAAPLFRAVIAAWIRAARRAGATPIIASTASDRRRLLSIARGGSPQWIEQRGGDFGERLASSASDAFAHGYKTVLIAGIDTAPPHDLAAAFVCLETGDARALIAPARDGGVNLIGLRDPAFDLLRRIAAGQRDLVDRFRERFPDLITLNAGSDIDSLFDIDHASLESDWTAFRPLLLGCQSEFRFPAAVFRLFRHPSDIQIPRAPPRSL